MKDIVLSSSQTKEKGSEWCNTDPAKCKELGNGIKLINLNVDSLYISFQGELKPGASGFLDYMKQEAISTGKPRVGYNYGKDGVLVIQPFGTKGYTYLLDGEDFSIKVGNGKVGPTIYSEIRAHFLYTLGFEQACKVVMDIIKEFTLQGSFLVSRIDLCADLAGWSPTFSLKDRILSRSRKKDYHEDGQTFTGISFGRGGNLSCRIYNKTVQIDTKGQSWIEKVWEANGWDSDGSDVWRIEFQLRREIIKEFKVNEPHEVFEALNSIWKYCTSEWLSLREPKENDDTRSRWPIIEWWQELSNLAFTSIGIEAVRDRFKGIAFDKINLLTVYLPIKPV